MIKRFTKYFTIVFLLFFLFIYFFGGNIYKYKLAEKTSLTLEQISKFESDVKNGIEIDLNDYVIKDKDYTNVITDINGKISSFINFGLKEIFKYFLKKVDI